jgi:polyhydroxyalkanoate synthesis repressor PhaR
MTQQVKLIKRYANRKLYDTERSCYVTLDEIAQMVKSGDDIQVIDNKSKDDLTAVTLAQIIVEEQKKVARMPLKLLRNIIQNSNEAWGHFYQKRVANPVNLFRDDVEKRVDGFLRKEKDAENSSTHQDTAPVSEKGSLEDSPEAGPDSSGDQADRAASPVRAFVASATDTFEAWQKNVDERVKEAFARMPNFSQSSSDLEEIYQRIATIDDRLKKVEDSSQPPVQT